MNVGFSSRRISGLKSKIYMSERQSAGTDLDVDHQVVHHWMDSDSQAGCQWGGTDSDDDHPVGHHCFFLTHRLSACWGVLTQMLTTRLANLGCVLTQRLSNSHGVLTQMLTTRLVSTGWVLTHRLSASQRILRCWSPLDGFWLTDWAPIRGYWLRWWSPGWSPLLFSDSGWAPTWEYSLRCCLPGADSTNDMLWAAYTKILMHAHFFYILLWHVILDYVEPQIR